MELFICIIAKNPVKALYILGMIKEETIPFIRKKIVIIIAIVLTTIGVCLYLYPIYQGGNVTFFKIL